MKTETPESEMDPVLLEMLETEFMEQAECGDMKAHTYAALYSDEWVTACSAAVSVLFEAGLTPSLLTAAVATRNRLTEVLRAHVAPMYAREHYDARIEEFEEMREEQQV